MGNAVGADVVGGSVGGLVGMSKSLVTSNVLLDHPLGVALSSYT